MKKIFDNRSSGSKSRVFSRILMFFFLQNFQQFLELSTTHSKYRIDETFNAYYILFTTKTNRVKQVKTDVQIA